MSVFSGLLYAPVPGKWKKEAKILPRSLVIENHTVRKAQCQNTAFPLYCGDNQNLNPALPHLIPLVVGIGWEHGYKL